MSVKASHDIAIDLQHKVEAMDEVERCFVHVDYRSRSDEPPEHKMERDLLELASGEKQKNRGVAGEFLSCHKFVQASA